MLLYSTVKAWLMEADLRRSGISWKELLCSILLTRRLGDMQPTDIFAR